jgi:hypothetical protein
VSEAESSFGRVSDGVVGRDDDGVDLCDEDEAEVEGWDEEDVDLELGGEAGIGDSDGRTSKVVARPLPFRSTLE